MQEQEGLNAAQRELEEALRSLAPTVAKIDPIRAAFGAGRTSARRQIRGWQSATGLLLLVAAGSWLLPASRPAAGPAPRFPGSQLVMTSQPSDRQPWSDQSMLMLQNAMWRNGPDGLPSAELPSIDAPHANGPL